MTSLIPPAFSSPQADTAPGASSHAGGGTYADDMASLCLHVARFLAAMPVERADPLPPDPSARQGLSTSEMIIARGD